MIDKVSKETYEEVRRLTINNPFGDRILYLLKNQKIAKEPVLNLHGKTSPPNCIGTALWVAGVSKLDYPYHAYEDELNEHMIDEDDNRDELIKALRSNPKNKILGAFCFSYSVEADWHAGIYLGRIKEQDFLFSQNGHGKPFVIGTSLCFANPRYFIPRTLKK